MESRVSFGKFPPDTFFEDRFFDLRQPYSVRYKTVPQDDIAQVHYSTSLEVFVSINVDGVFMIDGKTWKLDKLHAFVVPPYSIHSVSLKEGTGQVYLLQFSFEALEPYLGLVQLLNLTNRRIHPHCVSEDHTPVLLEQLRSLIKHDQDLMRCMHILLDLIIGIATISTSDKDQETPVDKFKSSNDIQAIILWTMNHFRRPISLDEVAKIAGYTKSYFCTWFKKNTGINYQTYLNILRINYSCEVLRKTSSIATACESVGFSNQSYFIQLFRKIKGYTPMQYIRACGKNNESLSGPNNNTSPFSDFLAL
ncbi:MAG: helix-turn-helix transcriptional regulator [Christensenellales bacterium]